MDLEKAQSLLGAVGTDDAPSIDELRGARSAFVDAAKTAKGKGDREALASMLAAMKLADQAIDESEKALAAQAAELDALTEGIPEFESEAAEEAPAEETPAAAKSVPQVLSVQEAAARLGLVKEHTQRAEVTEREPRQMLTINGNRSDDATLTDLADSFAKTLKTSTRGGRTTIATFTTEYDTRLPGKVGENTRILDSLARRAGEEAVTAAGGCCSLAEPIRTQPMLSSTARPIADALPTVGTSAGAVTFFPPVCLPTGGVGTWTCEDDAAVDPADEETWKQCYEVACEEAEDVQVEAIYRCLEIGNFQQRFNPERWDAILQATLAQQARAAEVALFDGIYNSDHVTTHTVTDTGSIYVTLAHSLLRAAATIRQNQRYIGARIKAILPSWVADAVEQDLLTRAIVRGRSIPSESIETLLASKGVDIIWSPDIDPIEPNGQTDGPLTEFPDDARAVLYVDGGVFRLDGGEINLGTDIRDHDLNRQNKLAAFSESFENVVVRSCDSKALTIPVTICDAAECVTGS